jgi:hypothetical protein
MKTPHQARGLGFVACAAAGALWGCSFLAGKIALLETDFAHMIRIGFCSLSWHWRLFSSTMLAFAQVTVVSLDHAGSRKKRGNSISRSG